MADHGRTLPSLPASQVSYTAALMSPLSRGSSR